MPGDRSRLTGRRAITLTAPTLVAAALALAYVLISPPSLDLAAALFRARLFEREGWGVWNNLWYSGHDTPGYSVLFPAVSAALTPQLAAALAATATAPVFTALAWRHRGRDALGGALLFGAFTAVDLFTGRLAFAFGLLPATAAVLSLDVGRRGLACLLAVASALCSPVAALFVAIVAAGHALGGLAVASRAVASRGDARRSSAGSRLRAAGPGAGVAAAALVPVAALAVAFPEGGTEPFELATLLPVLAVALAGAACAGRDAVRLRAGLAVYAGVLVTAYLVASPVGSNAARLGTLLAAPVATVVLWDRRPRLLAAAIAPLVYIGVQAPVQNVVAAAGQPSTSAAFYRPLLHFLARQGGPPFRIEIPFTALHWEAYRVALRVPIARGWERQLDERDNPIFYRRGALTAGSYRRWLHANAIRFVALPATALDPSARAEAALIRSRPSYLRPVAVTGAWRIYAVRSATAIAEGPATLTALGPDWLTLRARRPGRVLLHVHFTPYWALVRGTGCVAPAGDLTRLTLRRPGPVRLAIRIALGRVGASSPRCTRGTSARP